MIKMFHVKHFQNNKEASVSSENLKHKYYIKIKSYAD